MVYKKNKGNALVLRNDVCQSNPLVNARKVFDLLGMRIFLLGLRGLNPHFSDQDKYYDKEFPSLFIPTSKLTELFGNTKYLAELKPACKKLFDTIIELNHANGGFELYHLFRELKYEPGEGLYLQFDELLRPYILDLFQTRGYTRINVEYLFKLSSPYAIRLLELLLQYQNIKLFKELMEIKRKMTIEELRFVLNVPEGAYSDRVDNFRKFVLDDPIKEINVRTPYIVRYQTVKEGRRVVAFEFIMDTYKVPKDEKDDSYQFGRSCYAIETLCSLGFTEKVARAIFAKCLDEADCFSRINRAQGLLDRNKRPVKNKLGFLRKAIEENWQIGRRRTSRGGKPIASAEGRSLAKVDDSAMTSIGEILSSMSFGSGNKQVKPPEDPMPEMPPQPIKIGRKKMARPLAETFIKYIRKGEMLEAVEESLKDFNTTIEKFTALCNKHGI